MTRDRKLLIYVTFVSLCTIAFLILYYEFDKHETQKLRISNGVKIKNEYTAEEIADLIKNEENYLGDSVVIYEDGTLKTMNSPFQGTIDNITQNPPDVNLIEDLVQKTQLPRPVMVYRLAAHYYLTQYPDERKKLEEKKRVDSLTTKSTLPGDSARIKDQ